MNKPEINQIVDCKFWTSSGRITGIWENVVSVEFKEKELVWEEFFYTDTFISDWNKGIIHLAEDKNNPKMDYTNLIRTNYSALD